jgi:uncharacterized membrane protein
MDNTTFLQCMNVKHNIHWHVISTHFPISFFTASANFIILHLLTKTECFELAGSLCLIAGVMLTIPTTITGWTTWKSKYKGARTKIFTNKIILFHVIILVGMLMILFRAYFVVGDHTLWHYIFGFGFVALFFASMMEGYYGGRLNQR